MSTYGNAAVIGIAMQNSFGTAAVVSSLHQIPILNESFGVQQEELLSKNLNGRFEEGDSYSGKRQYGGQLETEAGPKSLGVLLTAMNAAPSVVVSGSVNAYSFTPRTGDWDGYGPNRPFTYYKYLAEAGSAQMLYDLIANRFELQMSEGGFLIARFNGVGGKTSAVASSALTVEGSRRWPWNQATLTFSGAQNALLTDFSLVHDEGISPKWTIDGNLTAGRAVRQSSRTIRLNGTMLFASQSEMDNFKNEVTQPFQITVQDTTTAIQSGYYSTLQIIIPTFRWIQFQVPVRGPQALEVNFQARGMYNAGSGNVIKYILTNTWAAGY